MIGTSPLYDTEKDGGVHAMLDGLLKSPEKFDRCMQHRLTYSLPLPSDNHNAGYLSIPMKTMYGYDVKSVDDPCVINPEKSARMAVHLVLPGATLINI